MLALLLATLACRSDEDFALQFRGDPPKNILMISIDTLRRDRLARYGGPDTMPFLGQLMDEGLTLDDHRSCSNWTYAGALCALAGRTGYEVGFVPGAGATEQPLPDGVRLLSTALGEQGFQSALFTTNHFVGSTPKLKRYYDAFEEAANAPAQEVSEGGLALLEGLSSPWLLHLHYVDPHAGYDPPGDYLGGLEGLAPPGYDLDVAGGLVDLEADWAGLSQEEQALALAHLEARYDGELAWLDDQLRALLEGLEARGALADTLVVVWSDHGEAFGERGQFEHGNTMNEEELGAIALFWSGDIVPGALPSPTTHADLLPTLLAGLGLPPEPGLSPLEGADPERAVFASQRTELSQHAVVQGGWKLTYRWDGAMALYDLTADPGEQRDRLTDEPARAEALWALLRPRVEGLAAQVSEDAAPPVWP
jgi:arylsulfatase A-like enzyme